MGITVCSLPVYGDASDQHDFDALEVTRIIGKTDINDLKASSAILVDAKSGGILFKKNPDEKLPIASITKIMSMLLIMEELDSGKISLSDMVKTSEYAYGFGGSQVYLEPGEEFSLEDMLKAIAIHSANDATVAVAEKIAGSEDAFVQMMNAKADELGMENSRFLDCTGLTDEGHYCTAKDIAIMSRELIVKHPGILKYTKMWHSPFRDMELYNRNKLVRHYDGATGLKTGYTDKAGHCVSATAERNGMSLISVVLGEPDTNTRFAEAQKLLNYGFASFEYVKVEDKGVLVCEAEVRKGLERTVKGQITEELELLLRKGDSDKVKREIIVDESIEAPVEKGQKLGEAVYSIEGYEKPLARLDIVAETEVKKASFFRLFFRMILDWFGIGRK